MTDDTQQFVLTFKTRCSVAWLRHLLKRVGRDFGLRCIKIEPGDAGQGQAVAPGQREREP